MIDVYAQGRITRFEVIDETGRVYVRDPRISGPIDIAVSIQDDGRTLKIFVAPKQERPIS
jgi:hypothetical protein